MSSKWNSWDAARDLKTVHRLNRKAGTSTTVTFTWRVPEKRKFSITWLWADHSEDVGQAVNKNSNRNETSASQGFMVKKDPAQGQRATRWGSKWLPVSEDACDSSTVTWDRICSQFQAAADVHRLSSVPLMLLSFEAGWEMSCSSARSKSDPGLERFPSRQLKIVFSLA